MTLTETARAKVNLALHVVGRRADGYHLLDTIAVFPPVGDRLDARPADELSLTVTGPGAAALAGTSLDDNLVMRAARGLAAIAADRWPDPAASSSADPSPGAALILEKHLPVAAGVGGGSADAAAAIRLLVRLWRLDRDDPRIADLARSLGADVPMCLASAPLRARGIGEALTPLPDLPAASMLLVNPRIAVSTPAVFQALDRRDNPPLPDAIPTADREALIGFLSEARNDLEPAAIAVAPAIAAVLETLRALPGQRLVRMSGSGATCFALFDTEDQVAEARSRVARDAPDWWVG